MQRFCSSPDGVMVCGNADGREVYAVTHDIVPDKGWVMQFKVTNEPQVTRRVGVAVVPLTVPFCPFRLRWVAASLSATPTGRFTFSIRWTSA